MGFRVAKPGEMTPPPLPEIDQVWAMRTHRLIEAGFTSDQADRLAQCTHVDLHKAESLAEQVIARGLDAQVAFEILI